MKCDAEVYLKSLSGIFEDTLYLKIRQNSQDTHMKPDIT